MRVVDASIISSFILKEPGWEGLTEILSNAVTIDHAIKESLNAVWKALERGYINRKDADVKAKALFDLAKLNLEIVDEIQVMGKAFSIACSRKMTLYDALYVALAKLKATTLYTLDQKQAQRSKDIVDVNLIKL